MKKWNEDLELGIGFIDRAHKELFDMFNRIMDRNTVENSEVFNLLIHFKYYFADEESLLLDIEFPDYLSHKKEHKLFIQELEGILTDTIKGNKNHIEKTKLEVLSDSFFSHILEKDVHIKEHFFSL